MSERHQMPPFNREGGLDWKPGINPDADRLGDPTSVPVPKGCLAKELDRLLAEPPAIPSPVAARFAADPSLEHPSPRTNRLNRVLLGMTSGERIRNLRATLGWTQSVAAKELGVSLRTVIRHEKGHRRAPWLRLPLLRRLCELEREHADQIVAYLDYREPERA
jgi:DNA-binding XRE family transcriptional regulator